MIIVKYNNTNQKNIERFFQKVFKEMDFSLGLEGKDSDIKNIESIYVKNNGCFWTVIHDESVIGSIGFKKITDSICELKRFYLLERYRNRGLGQRLLKILIDEAKAYGYNRIRLDTTYDSSRAIELFKKNGFYEIDRYNDDIYAEIFMEKKI